MSVLVGFGQTEGNRVEVASRYVDIVSGDDNDDGLSKETAWKTLQHAADRMEPGETCLVLPGRYSRRVTVRKSGTVHAPIKFEGKAAVVMRGFTIEADYIHIEGFEITDTEDHWKDGVGVFVEGKGCVIEGNFVHDVARVGIQVFARDPDSPETANCKILNNRVVRAGLAGIEVYGRDHLVYGNEISQTLQYPRKWKNPPDWADADGIHFFGSGHILRKNYIHSISLKHPENIDPHIDAIQTFGPAYRIVIEENVFAIPDPGMQIAMIEQRREPVTDIVFRNNLFIDTFRGLNIWNRRKAPLSKIAVVNNMFFRIENYAVEFHDCTQVTVSNNVFYDVGSQLHPYLALDRTHDSEVSYNCHFMSEGRSPAGKPAAGDLWQIDPKLLNVKENDFRPLPGSPLIDAGRELDYVRKDAAGNERPFGGTTDIGAYEFVGLIKR